VLSAPPPPRTDREYAAYSRGVSPALSAVLSTSPHKNESSISAIAPRREFATASCNAARKCEKKVLSAAQEQIIPRLGAVDELARHDAVEF